MGSYSLRIRRNVTHNARMYRCAAYLSAPRRASGTESFRGSVPSGLQCAPAGGDGPLWQPHTLKGSYQAVVCVAADRNLCKPGFSVATKTVRVSYDERPRGLRRAPPIATAAGVNAIRC